MHWHGFCRADVTLMRKCQRLMEASPREGVPRHGSTLWVGVVQVVGEAQEAWLANSFVIVVDLRHEELELYTCSHNTSQVYSTILQEMWTLILHCKNLKKGLALLQAVCKISGV